MEEEKVLLDTELPVVPLSRLLLRTGTVAIITAITDHIVPRGNT